MASITENANSRDADLGVEQSTRTLKYTVTGSEDDAAVEALVQATVPAFWRGLQLQAYRVAPQGNGVWEAEARYTSRQVKEVGQSSFTFDTTGGTQKLKTSKATQSFVRVDPDVGAAEEIDFGHAINVTGEGESRKVEGVDTPLSKFAFTVTRVIADPLPTAYAVALEVLTAHVNINPVVLNVSGVIYTFDVGELLYLGATGGKRGTADWEITLRCEVSRNATNIVFPIPSDEPAPVTITVPLKFGWDYLWVAYEQRVVKGELIPVPLQVMVEQVSDYADLNVLFS